MSELINIDNLADIISNKAAIKYSKLYGMDDLSQFDKDI